MHTHETLATEDAERADKFEFGARTRRFDGWRQHAFVGLSAAYCLFHIAVLNVVPLDEWVFRTIHVTVGSAIAFLLYSARSTGGGGRVPWYDWLAILLSLACCAYIWLNVDELIGRTGVLPTQMDAVVAAIGTVLVVEITRRTAGLALPIICLVFIAYVFVGPWLPGILNYRGYEVDLFFSFIYSMEGIFGMTTAASSQFIILFVAFAAFLQASKTGEYFINLAIGLFGGVRGGPAKVTVVSGVLFGTISGSAVANVVASGMFSIPMMRRVGYSRTSAAAVEATSSTGGQLVPPVMGAGAFLMAEITGIPYTDIALAALIPAGLFYVANYAHVDIEAIKQNIRGLPRSELPSIPRLLRQAYLLAPLIILIWTLLSGFSVIRAGTLGIVAAIVTSWLSRETRMGVGATIRALDDATRQSLQLVAVCACAGIIVGVLGLTGLGGRFSAMILSIAGESQFLALLFAMLIALLLGMGMPTTAAYAIAAAVVAPGLQQMGIPPLVAHLFIFYYAVISAITPPVALASFAAAALAGSDPWKTSFESVRYGVGAFVVPFMFFYQPAILLQGDALSIVVAVITAVLGVLSLAFASEAWLGMPLGWPMRGLLLCGGLFLMGGAWWGDLAGGAILVFAYAMARIYRSKNGGS
ncbi:TRAP transporter 4TM/12TM fusion protein [Stella humosa]|uniref:TRAP transporter 4TM/12TM fusion protein n=1 Tax=Stella humosa TaxID=94 RepID=A0A3N1LBY4_9PROT|nr:TRAP transporter permease [Stella humosa]ROP90501.1 TRAP transporter 4TM/12TM fusion protein [Stella humosa]BBK29606.1 C4-dicarboxylate ABC transporter [Stella humosa]